jgi:hypothetical protein
LAKNSEAIAEKPFCHYFPLIFDKNGNYAVSNQQNLTQNSFLSLIASSKC